MASCELLRVKMSEYLGVRGRCGLMWVDVGRCGLVRVELKGINILRGGCGTRI